MAQSANILVVLVVGAKESKFHQVKPFFVGVEKKFTLIFVEPTKVFSVKAKWSSMEVYSLCTGFMIQLSP